MAASGLQNFRHDLSKKLHEPSPVTDVLAKVEAKTGVDRLYLVSGIAGLFGLYLIFGHFAELVCNFIGFLYPAYMSVKAIESVGKDDDTQWLTYWVVFALFNVIEFAADAIVGWFPVYWLCKCALMLYLHLPMTMGAQKLYVGFIRPFIIKHQATIDSRLGMFMNRTAETVKSGADLLKQN